MRYCFNIFHRVCGILRRSAVSCCVLRFSGRPHVAKCPFRQTNFLWFYEHFRVMSVVSVEFRDKISGRVRVPASIAKTS